MTVTIKPVLAMLGLALMLVAVSASQAQNRDQSLRGKLEQAIEVASQNQLEIISVKPTPLSTIYEVELNTGEILYSDISGDYLFAGDMYRTGATGLVNISTRAKQERSLVKIAAIPIEEMIIFTPDVVKASITVFTDVDCTYCRKLHSELDDLMAKGIEVRYLAYPRGGAEAASYDKMISVWCSDDRKKSLTQAKNGQNLPAGDCDSPVLAHHALGNELGISGTPALIFPDGTVIPGYMDADRLATMLKIN
ncbi:MAG: protein-disulfide isomerase [SAR86 cluster bacterium]|uniref:Thiol:disulfide interchange protein n=1 Tax=SAR86 cluster bacterium TaxID=2030880 RepID=A0A2A4X9Q5_9GAMM|nr:MAG: protein-disulfide isomerase [SAR86 cluster bacterium]